MRRASIIMTIAALASCSSGDDTASDTGVETTASNPETTTTAVATTTTTAPAASTSTTSTTTTTVDPTWNRDAELAVRQCLDAAQGAALWIPFMYEFDDDSDVRAIQDACDAAADQLDLEDGQAARDVALIIAEINLKLAFEMVNYTGGETEWVDPPFDYSLAAFEAEELIP